MTRTRRFIAAAAVAGALAIPFAVSSAAPAAAYCENDPVALSDGSGSGGNGCSNSCKDLATAYQKITGKPAPFDCLQ